MARRSGSTGKKIGGLLAFELFFAPSIWGESRTEFEAHEADVIDSDTFLGGHDCLVLFDASDRESAFKSALTLRRHGLSAETMEVTHTDDFAHLVDEV